MPEKTARKTASFENGRVYGLYGENGSGKTMLLRALGGLIVKATHHKEDLRQICDQVIRIRRLRDIQGWYTPGTGKRTDKICREERGKRLEGQTLFLVFFDGFPYTITKKLGITEKGAAYVRIEKKNHSYWT